MSTRRKTGEFCMGIPPSGHFARLYQFLVREPDLLPELIRLRWGIFFVYMRAERLCCAEVLGRGDGAGVNGLWPYAKASGYRGRPLARMRRQALNPGIRGRPQVSNRFSMWPEADAVGRSGASMKASPPRIAVSCTSVSPVWIYRASLFLADSALYSRAHFSLSKTCDDSFSGVCASFPLPFCQFLLHFLIASQLRLLRSVSNFFPGCWTYIAVII